MDFAAADDFLRIRGAPPDMYSLGRDANEAWCVVRDRSGWIVYYSERGNKNDVRRYAHESDACMDLVARVVRQLERDAEF